MASPVKRPAKAENAEEEKLFDKLVAVSTKYDKTQYDAAIAEIATIKTEAAALKKTGVDTKNLEREIKRQEGRHKMDKFDAEQA